MMSPQAAPAAERGVRPQWVALMANGKRGDSPLSDMLIHGLHPFPADLEALLREVLSLQPKFPDGKRRYLEQLAWMGRFDDWARGQNLEEGRAALLQVLAELKSSGEQQGAK